MQRLGPREALTAALVGALLGLACGPGNQYAAPPPPAVTVARPEVRDVVRYSEYTGRTQAVEEVELRARVGGYLASIEFAPGDTVEQGELLFVIDPRPFQIALEAAEAERASARAELARAQSQLEREEQALETRAISELEVIQSRATRDKAAASLRNAESAVADAELDLDFAYVKAPIAGRVSRNLVTVGNLIAEETVLAQMVRYDPMHVYFNVSERDVLAFQDRSVERRRTSGEDFESGTSTFEMGLADEKGYPHQGYIDYAAPQVDPDTGTLELRGVLPNAGPFDDIVLPGLFVRVRVPVADVEGALLVEERAVGSDQSGRFVLVVNEQNVVEQRGVELGPLIDGRYVIDSGLRREDRVVVTGIQRARPGSTVAPEEAERQADSPSEPDAAS